MEESQYALVTGCDHGVGLSLVKELLKRGYQVLAVRIRKEEHTVDDLMAEYPGKLTIVTADIGKDEEVETIRGMCAPLCGATKILREKYRRMSLQREFSIQYWIIRLPRGTSLFILISRGIVLPTEYE